MQLGEIIILHKNSVWQIYRAVRNIYIIKWRIYKANHYMTNYCIYDNQKKILFWIETNSKFSI